MFIKRLSTINCSGSESFLSSKLDNFRIQAFLKDFPPPKESTLKDFQSGKLGFFRLFIPKEKTDFHVHFHLRMETEKRKRNVSVNIEFCKNQKHFESKTDKQGKKYSYLEDFFPWLSKYFVDFSKVTIYSNIEYSFSNKKYKTIFNLPFPFDISSDQIGFEGIKLSGLKLSLTDSKIGLDTIFVDTDEDNINVYIEKVAKHFDESYFDSIFESTSKLATIFIKELKNEKSI